MKDINKLKEEILATETNADARNENCKKWKEEGWTVVEILETIESLDKPDISLSLYIVARLGGGV